MSRSPRRSSHRQRKSPEREHFSRSGRRQNEQSYRDRRHRSPHRYKSHRSRSPRRIISPIRRRREVSPTVYRHQSPYENQLGDGKYTFQITRTWNEPKKTPEVEHKVVQPPGLPATWFDLPYEMKSEVLSYLDIEERSIFAHCSKQISMDVFDFETNWSTAVFEKNGDCYTIRLGSDVNSQIVKIEFRKYRNGCDIRWDWGKKAGWKKNVESRNVERIAMRFFEKLVPKFKNSLRCLMMKKINNIEIEEKSAKIFPKLEELSIITSDEKTLYWLLANSPNLKTLTVSFHENSSMFKVKQRFRILKIWELEKLEGLEIETNSKLVAENVLSRSKNLTEFKYKFHCDDVRNNERIVEILKTTKVKSLEFFSCLNDQQFNQLVEHCERVKCSIGNITFNSIHRLIEQLMNDDIRRNFSICHVEDVVLLSRTLNLSFGERSSNSDRGNVYYSTRVRNRMFNTLIGKLCYFEDRRFLTFQMVIR